MQDRKDEQMPGRRGAEAYLAFLCLLRTLGFPKTPHWGTPEGQWSNQDLPALSTGGCTKSQLGGNQRQLA